MLGVYLDIEQRDTVLSVLVYMVWKCKNYPRGDKMDLSFKRNIGKLDRMVRIILGIGLLYIALLQPLTISLVWVYLAGIAGIFMVIEGAAGY